MILDVINNIERYKDMPDIYTALKELVSLDKNMELGTYQISDNVNLIVSEYKTKIEDPNKFEAHTRHIDIQYPLIGNERIEWHNIEEMEKITDYDSKKDRAYYSTQDEANSFVIGGGHFAIFHPEDTHKPCLKVNNKVELIKKATFKIKIS